VKAPASPFTFKQPASANLASSFAKWKPPEFKPVARSGHAPLLVYNCEINAASILNELKPFGAYSIDKFSDFIRAYETYSNQSIIIAQRGIWN